jgi:hypothetical protein
MSNHPDINFTSFSDATILGNQQLWRKNVLNVVLLCRYLQKETWNWQHGKIWQTFTQKLAHGVMPKFVWTKPS